MSEETTAEDAVDNGLREESVGVNATEVAQYLWNMKIGVDHMSNSLGTMLLQLEQIGVDVKGIVAPSEATNDNESAPADS